MLQQLLTAVRLSEQLCGTCCQLAPNSSARKKRKRDESQAKEKLQRSCSRLRRDLIEVHGLPRRNLARRKHVPSNQRV